jgi:hypothetical protein
MSLQSCNESSCLARKHIYVEVARQYGGKWGGGEEEKKKKKKKEDKLKRSPK